MKIDVPGSVSASSGFSADGAREAGLTARIVYWSITSALAGFLFGFDTVVISGAEETIQALWHLSPALHGVALGSALYGTLLGSLVGGWPTEHWGRRKTLIFVGFLFIISALGCGFAHGVTIFILARAIGGIGIGISTVVAPLYISEIAPPRYRGRMAGAFQFNIVFGIIAAFGSNAVIDHFVQHDAWRWMLGVAVVPSVIYLILCMGLPESPRWLLLQKRDRANGIAILRLIEPHLSGPALEARADEIGATTASDGAGKSQFWTRKMRTPIMLAFFVAFFNQLSGINAVLYFAPRIFELTGLAKQSALLQSIGIGITNLLFTFLGLYLIDRVGRRTLLYIGSFGYIVSLGAIALAFFTKHYAVVPWCIFAFIGAHAVGQGSVIWVLISEVFPNRQRASGQALGSFTHWVFAALLTTFFPQMVTAFAPGYVFLFFCFMMVLQLVWVKLQVPETRGVSLEKIQALLGSEP